MGKTLSQDIGEMQKWLNALTDRVREHNSGRTSDVAFEVRLKVILATAADQFDNMRRDVNRACALDDPDFYLYAPLSPGKIEEKKDDDELYYPGAC